MPLAPTSGTEESAHGDLDRPKKKKHNQNIERIIFNKDKLAHLPAFKERRTFRDDRRDLLLPLSAIFIQKSRKN